MNRLIIICCGLFLIILGSCKQAKESSTTNPSTEKINTEIKSPINPDSLPATSRLVVTFFSIASGVDFKAVVGFEEFIGEYAAEQGFTVDYEKTHWGREGETDFCLELKELTPEQQTDFVSQARKRLETAEHVSIYENQACKHRRKRE